MIDNIRRRLRPTLGICLVGSALNGCGSGSTSQPPPNPVPSISSVSPSTATRGGSSFTLTVNGSNFASASTVQWNGSPRQTSFVSLTQLTAQISADDISVAGTYNITVVNPAPGGGPSGSVAFNIPCVLAAPGPASSQTRARLGAYYFDGWAGPLNSYHLNFIVNGPYQDRQPLSGWRDDNSCAVEQQLAWAHSFGLNFFVFDWYFNTAVNDAGGNEDLNSALKLTHSMTDRHGMQFAILYVNQPPFVISQAADWTSAVNEWMGYMTDPAYVLVNGKPLLIVIDLYGMRQAFGSSSAVDAAFGQLRAAAKAHGFPGAYIVGGTNFYGGSPVPAGASSVDGIFPDLSMAVADGYDAISMYDYASGLQNVGGISGLQPFSTISDTGHWIWNNATGKSPLPFIPVVMDGFDPRPQPPPSPATTFWVNQTPQDVTTLASDAITWAESNPAVRPEKSPAAPIVLLSAWNELLGGSDLVPTVGNGTSYGDSLATMLASPSPQTRSMLTLNDSGPADPNRMASGKLTDANGIPITGATVSLTYTASTGSYTPYQLSGQAPASAVQAVVGFRINTDYPAAWPGYWFAGPEPINISVYQASYVQPADGIERILNGNFASGSQSWTLQGQSQIAASDRGAGQMVQVIGAANQSAALDSLPFSVTGGASFQLTFSARIAPSSSGSGYFLLAFKDASGNFVPIPGPNSSDLKSETIPFTLGKVAIGTTKTDANGNFQLSLTSLGALQVILEGAYGGDSQHWPAYEQVVP